MNQQQGPQGGPNDQQNPMQWSGRPPYAGGNLPPAPPAPAPKKRNWFARHKVLTGLLGVFAVIVIGSAATAGAGGSDPQSSAAPTAGETAADTAAGSGQPAATKAAAKKTAEKKNAAPGIGTPVKSGDLQFTVTKVVRDRTTVGQQYLTEKAQGRYTLVYVTVRNVGNDSELLLDSEQKIKDADNKTYSPDTTAELSMKNNDVFLEEINPGNAVDGVLVYDMPVGVKATAIDFNGSDLFDDATTVQLH
ncbi:DUF4352 domain-containing protein [Flexivirga sp. B27]